MNALSAVMMPLDISVSWNKISLSLYRKVPFLLHLLSQYTFNNWIFTDVVVVIIIGACPTGGVFSGAGDTCGVLLMNSRHQRRRRFVSLIVDFSADVSHSRVETSWRCWQRRQWSSSGQLYVRATVWRTADTTVSFSADVVLFPLFLFFFMNPLQFEKGIVRISRLIRPSNQENVIQLWKIEITRDWINCHPLPWY